MNKDRDQNVVSSLIIFAIVVMLVFAITGCSTAVPVSARFPEPPGKGAVTACANLQKLSNGAQLSDVANTVAINYGTYYECAVKVDAWQEWYGVQKIIFEKAGK